MTEASPRRRDASIDVLRGVVMCVMVLDHVRDFATSPTFNATDATKTNLALFFTRFITHYCAPIFVFSAGLGAGLAEAAGRSRAATARFLVSRGLWLVVLELTVVRFGWWFELTYHTTVGQVIWALGWSMVILGGLVLLGPIATGVIGAAMILGHNALDGIAPERFGAYAWGWQLLHTGGRIPLDEHHHFFVAYPLVPWIGVMALGHAVGTRWRALEPATLVRAGTAAIFAFVILRAMNGYGDPHPRAPQESALRAVFAFLDCQKYPPSLDYLLMTLGPALVALGIMRTRALDGLGARVLLAYGQAPLFFYLIHLPVVHGLAALIKLSRGQPMSGGPFGYGLDFSLPVVYALWLLALVILYFPTARWAQLKRSRRDWWLSYL